MKLLVFITAILNLTTPVFAGEMGTCEPVKQVAGEALKCQKASYTTPKDCEQLGCHWNPNATGTGKSLDVACVDAANQSLNFKVSRVKLTQQDQTIVLTLKFPNHGKPRIIQNSNCKITPRFDAGKQKVTVNCLDAAQKPLVSGAFDTVLSGDLVSKKAKGLMLTTTARPTEYSQDMQCLIGADPESTADNDIERAEANIAD